MIWKLSKSATALAVTTLFLCSLPTHSTLAGQGDSPFQPQNGIQDNSAKSSSETWKEYVTRLHKDKILTDAQKADWEQGNSVKLSRTINVSKFHAEQRIRMVPVPTTVEKLRDGKIVEETVTEMVQQTYTVNVPYNESFVISFDIPAPGTKPDDMESPGFVGAVKAAQEAPPILPQADSIKQANESWQDYIDRLHAAKALSKEMKAQWEAGESITLAQTETVVRFRQERRQRDFPTTRNRIEERNGERVLIPVTEMVERDYFVNVPYSDAIVSELRIPGKGSQPEDAVNQGFQEKNEEAPVTDQPAGEDGNAVVPAQPADENPQETKAPEQLQVDRLKQIASKTENETWDEYVRRLHENQIISNKQLEKWKAGEKFKVGLTIDVEFRQETKTREVAVTRMQNFEENGATVARPITTNETQTYVVMVKVDETIEGMMRLPARGTQAENAATTGFLFRTIQNDVGNK